MRSAQLYAGTAFALALLSPRAEAAPKAAGSCIETYERAQRERREENWAESIAHFRECADRQCPQMVSQECTAWAAEAERARDAADKSAAPPVPPPEAPSPAPESTTKTAERTTAPPLSTAPEPAADSSPNYLLPAVLGGVGVVGIAGFAFFGLRAKSDRDDLAGTCKPYCASDDVDSVRRQMILADVSLGVGVLALGAAGYFLISTPSRDSAPSAFRVGVSPVASGAGAVVAGHF